MPLSRTVLSTIFTLTPQKAIAFLQRKNIVPTWSWDELHDEAHHRAFTVAKLLTADLLQFLLDELIQAQQEGKTLRQFQDSVIPRLQAAGWWGTVPARAVPRDNKQPAPRDPDKTVLLGSLSRLKTIYQTNMQTAYMAGRFKQQQQSSNLLPYWQYIATVDKNTTAGCRLLDGVVLRHDDPFWSRNYPPRHYNCRSRVRALNERMMQQMRISPSDSRRYADVNAADGFNTTPDKPFVPDTSSYHPVLKDAVERDLSANT